MAVTDIAEDGLDEMLREEAEDVFYGDGRLAKGQLYRVKAGVGLEVGCSRIIGRSDWLLCDLRL